MSTANDGEAYFRGPEEPAEDAWEPPAWDYEDWSGYENEYPDSWYDWYEDGFYEDFPEDEWYDGEEAPLDGEGGEESFPVKGKGFGKGKRGRGNALGVGCSTCGSKWHDASACPVKGQGRRDGGHFPPAKGWTPKGKGYGKPRFPGKGKGKGYGCFGGRGFKGRGKYGSKGKWRGYAEWPDDSYYQRDKNLVGHFGTDTYAAFPTTQAKESNNTKVFNLDKDDRDILERKPAVTFAESTEEEETAGTQEGKLSKNLSFHFLVSLYAEREHFHMIDGAKRRGLLVDPGASNGLIGSETLRDMMSSCLGEKELSKVRWNSKTAQVSGISGAKDQTLGEITVPVNFGNGRGSFTADVLGGEGSLCPALLSNPALRKMSSVIFTNFFDNGDGLLACHAQNAETPGSSSEWSHCRLLLTDSGHYLLPVDKSSVKVQGEATSKAASFLQTTAKVVKSQWSDVRHCFYSAGNAELERSEVYHAQSKDCSVARDPSESPVEDCSVPRDPSESPVEDCSVPRDPSESPEDCSVPRDILCEQPVGPESYIFGEQPVGPESQVHRAPKHPSTRGVFLLSSDDPLYRQPAKDEWTLFGDVLTRHHHVPSRSLFTPSCTKDCPVEAHLLAATRETSVRMKGDNKIIRDSWRQASHPNRDLGHLWTGVTKFKVRTEATKPHHEKPCGLKEAVPDFSEHFRSYDKDTFPEHWNVREREKAACRYASVPEEFYSRTKRRPVTPGNFRAWFAKARGKGLRWQLQELYSGSGRLSLMAVLSGLLVGFPVDYRYGWDLAMPEHQHMISQARDEFMPACLHTSPSSTAWNSSSRSSPLRQQERELEARSLNFVKDLCVEQSKRDLAFGVEQSLNSAMFQAEDCTMKELLELPNVRRRQQVDQCAHGCVDENAVPV